MSVSETDAPMIFWIGFICAKCKITLHKYKTHCFVNTTLADGSVKISSEPLLRMAAVGSNMGHSFAFFEQLEMMTGIQCQAEKGYYVRTQPIINDINIQQGIDSMDLECIKVKDLKPEVDKPLSQDNAWSHSRNAVGANSTVIHGNKVLSCEVAFKLNTKNPKSNDVPFEDNAKDESDSHGDERLRSGNFDGPSQKMEPFLNRRSLFTLASKKKVYASELTKDSDTTGAQMVKQYNEKFEKKALQCKDFRHVFLHVRKNLTNCEST